MSEYRIKGETLTGIADAIRSKTGGTEPIPVPEMAAQIEGITGGGGSSADVCYVTFMSHDGTVKLGRKAVAVRDDCADPIARGVFDTPTRESDAQYNYAFAGWSKNPDNVLDDTALDAVTEDRVVYAVYAATARSYTITFVDADGTVLETASYAYGATPSYTPTKDGYFFGRWEPELAPVTGDATYSAIWVEKIDFATGSWADIAKISEEGNAANYFSVGDTKTFTCNGESYTAEIVGLNHDDLSDGTGKAGISCLITTVYSDTCVYGDVPWTNSTVRSICNGTIYNALEANLKAVVKQVTKKSMTTNFNTVTTEDFCWVPNCQEANVPIGGESSTAYPGLADSSKRIVKSKKWHLRSVANTGYPQYMETGGTVQGNVYPATKQMYIRFGFCI